MSEYNQVRSFNLGIAEDTSVEAAMIYDDLAYLQNVAGKGQWFYRSYEKLLQRLPIMSERTMRNAINQLEAAGWITKKIMKFNGVPVCHYQICRILSAKTADSMVSAKTADSIYKTTKQTTKSDDSLLTQIITLVNPREKPTADRRRALRARLKDYTSEEIVAAAKAFSKSKWHRENKQMSVDNLLAPSKFGRWYAQKVEPRTAAGDVTDRDDDGTAYVNGQEVTVENQDEMVRRRMGGSDGSH